MPGRRSMTAYSPNPFFENKTPSVHLFQTCLRVSRLDGPDIRSVESLIERSLEAEAKGLQGRAYFDLGGPHASGDEWFRLALERVREAYFDNTVESSKRLLDERDRFDAPAIYMGWYTHHAYGNFKIPNWNVPAGAIALHFIVSLQPLFGMPIVTGLGHWSRWAFALRWEMSTSRIFNSRITRIA
jgi:uncharacterized protein (TIGR03790 family)